ncbi:envelope stress response membrane protein PspB [Sphingosinicella rhizophila]|uniref:Envelope stress response membrane protein PspB n=1 Tax=Sphingosinicella rhizophila TaxID=3050082 RepID=A0ABU3Q2C0_9SPHN|nr:envelope stress response membrane protein PspB [Sphingosinicella sp. GR2756]MDT9597560.1 envelope stress response membrane protein PspB [Sphingosinicella sp. GR2756]
MEEALIVIPIMGILFIGLPWMIFHYITKWKSQATLTTEDENLLDELHDLARRLDDRMCSIERIMTAENPNWRSLACDPASTGIEDSPIAGGRISNQPVERIGR